MQKLVNLIRFHLFVYYLFIWLCWVFAAACRIFSCGMQTLICSMWDLLCVCLVTQSCLTLCDPMNCSLPGSAIRGILQARILEWVAMPFSRGYSLLRGIFPTLGSNPGLLHCWQILYHLSHQESPKFKKKNVFMILGRLWSTVGY